MNTLTMVLGVLAVLTCCMAAVLGFLLGEGVVPFVGGALAAASLIALPVSFMGDA